VSAPTLDSKLDLESPEAKARAAHNRVLVKAAWVAIVCGITSLSLSGSPLARDVQVAKAAAPSISWVFAEHDCCGRLSLSQITHIGDLRSGPKTLAVYSLWFVNPQSHHGMMHLAFVEGDSFVGAYNISPFVSPSIAGDRISFECRDHSGCVESSSDDLIVENGVLPLRLVVDGEITELGDTI